MIRLNNSSLSARLTRMNLLVSGTVLLIASLAFFSYDLFSFRQTLIHNLDAEAQIVGENTISALTFDDQQSASTTLSGLERSHDVLAARLVTSDNREFATYGPSIDDQTQSHRLLASETDHVWASGTHVLIAHRIVLQGKTLGVVYISARLTEIGQRAREYLLIAALIMILCMAAALAISSISRRLIAKPIITLADTALLVSQDQDYTVRANIESNSTEITVLVDAFNTMLTQIQARDTTISEARAHLEARVAERTSELQAANRELEAFSYTVAHDLRGPLDAITSLVYLLTQTCDTAENAAVPPMLDQLKASTINMGSLIDDLLNFARATTTPVNTGPLNLSTIARDITAELAFSNPHRQVTFSIANTADVIADPGLVRIVLDNLLRNSWKYTSHHPHACIEFGVHYTATRARRDGRTVYFIRDDGAGFDPAQQQKLFQPFQRLHGRSEFPGTGIGLATVQRILSRQGGSIWAEGAVEKGATFYFTLD
ncbi:MAG: ATP-binding protein [Acidobacteriota bacterium]